MRGFTLPSHPVSRTDPSRVPALLSASDLPRSLPSSLAAPLTGTWARLSRAAMGSPRQALGGAQGAGTSPGRWLRPPLAETCHLPAPVDTHSSPSARRQEAGSKHLHLETNPPYGPTPVPGRLCQLVRGCGPWSLPGLWPCLGSLSALWLTCPRSEVGSVPNGGGGNAVATGKQYFCVPPGVPVRAEACGDRQLKYFRVRPLLYLERTRTYLLAHCTLYCLQVCFTIKSQLRGGWVA